ncbi:cellulose synthase/poly-beta-1,6-N-acetylglucosamine synthase-like glycosyltransferase [Alkalibacillus salilacus]|uniref:Cellulose synthase/poly-beta-1,6-N-acetylglucosamine synthase-like glycosyltransferase n=1 Tax=Alkalibacillus salilacus TaxID=284582 RepID=A0ABT9VDZ2_9BACI|nr:cellulose synthase/poly-beta-1,6-N-acetylglucosamine synthase-like glycosyltransferase [Alkalibacillus salilacus]
MAYFGTIIAVLSTVPFLTFFILFLLFRKWTGQATRSTKRAADYSTVLFLIAVIALLDYIFNMIPFWETLLAYIITFAIVLTIQWRREEEIVIIRAVRFVWRLSFVMLTVAYLLLVPMAILIKL